MAKTIVFCPTEDAAGRMREALVNCNKDIVKEHPDYVVRITGSDDYGKSKLSYFISVKRKISGNCHNFQTIINRRGLQNDKANCFR